MTYAIYKAGVPATVGTKTFATGQIASPVTATASYPAGVVSPVVGTAVYGAPNPTQPVVGIKMAGSLNANGVLTVAPGKNTPQS